MGKLHKTIRKFVKKKGLNFNNIGSGMAPLKLALGKEKYEKLGIDPVDKKITEKFEDNYEKLHPGGEQLEAQYDMTKQMQKDAEAAKAEALIPPKPPMPMADEEALAVSKRREAARRRRGRSSTILGGSADTLG